jgi:hypothetical protein
VDVEYVKENDFWEKEVMYEIDVIDFVIRNSFEIYDLIEKRIKLSKNIKPD